MCSAPLFQFKAIKPRNSLDRMKEIKCHCLRSMSAKSETFAAWVWAVELILPSHINHILVLKSMQKHSFPSIALKK